MAKEKSNKGNSYQNGKRWGYAVAKASIQTSKLNVYKMAKAMQTCTKNARTGTKKLNKNEKDAYSGIADGMYDAIRRSERN